MWFPGVGAPALQALSLQVLIGNLNKRILAWSLQCWAQLAPVGLFGAAPVREWREAMRVAHAHGRADLVETVVAPAAAEGAAALLADARDSEERIRKYAQRLADVRARRLALTAAVTVAGEEWMTL